MKPYIAILIDSFWEAVRNKVLWALLIGWSLILSALAPFGYISERSFKLSSSDIDNRTRLVEKLAKAAKGQGSLDVRAVAEHLEPEFLERVKKEIENKTPGKNLSERELAKALNVAIASQGLYSEEAFPTAVRRKRLVPLIEEASEGDLNEADLEELNRELLKLAFPLELNSPRAEQLYIGYAGFKLGEPLGITRRQISQFLEPVLLGVIIKIGLGVVAVFVALIVTSSIIPDTFKTGSLHLLLSKPISRVWLFLSKFLGGCIFVLVNISFVLVGLYLIAGTRFDIWNTGLLACIPLLMFVFVIFYSVSSLAGLLWGNPIVCVVTCMIFWLFCFGAGVVYEGMRPQVEVQQQVRKIRPVGENVLAVNEEGQLAIWNAKYSVWQPAIEPETRGQSRTFGPIYDEKHDLVVVKSFFRTPFGTLQGRSRKLSIIRLDEEETSGEGGEKTQEDVENAKDARDTPRWMADLGPELPQQVVDLIEADDAILAVTRGGIYKLNVAMLEAAEATETALFGFKLPWAATNAFQKVSPADFYLSENTSATTHASGDGIVVHSSGDISLLKPEGEQFAVVAQVSLKSLPLERETEQDEDSSEDAPASDGTEAAIAQMNENFCVVAREELPLVILTADFELLGEVEVPGGAKVRQTSWIPGTDHLAIVTHTGELFELDCENRKIGPLTETFFGECTSMNWLDSNRVWLGVSPNQAHLLNTSTGAVEQSCVPARTTFENIFGLVVKPLYLVNPKPSALDNAMNYLLSGNDTMATQFVTNDLEAAQIELDIWQPIFSNLAFVAVILGISCVYVARKEF